MSDFERWWQDPANRCQQLPEATRIQIKDLIKYAFDNGKVQFDTVRENIHMKSISEAWVEYRKDALPHVEDPQTFERAFWSGAAFILLTHRVTCNLGNSPYAELQDTAVMWRNPS